MAQWIARLFQQQFWPRSPNFAIQLPGLWYDEDDPRTHPAKRIKVDLKVCATCNNGWMSKLESRAKPLLSKLIFADGAIALSEIDADMLAAWSAKTLVNVAFERHRKAEHLVPPEVRDFIREHEAPPSDTTITAFKVDGLDTKVRTRVADVALRKQGGRQIGVVTVATILIGRVAVQMVHSSNGRPEPTVPAQLSAASLVLWPQDARPAGSVMLNWPTIGLPGEDAFEAICTPSEAEVATWIS